jgi:hypothetical protein
MDLVSYWQRRVRTGLEWWDDASYIIAQGDPMVLFEDLDPDDDRSLEEILSDMAAKRDRSRRAGR